jgi:hypothetical protein
MTYYATIFELILGITVLICNFHKLRQNIIASRQKKKDTFGGTFTQ